MNIIKFEPRNKPVLTTEAMDVPSWEPALTLPLPENPTSALLIEAREQVLTYLSYVANDYAAGRVEDSLIETEIQRGAARLIELTVALREAWVIETRADIEAEQKRFAAEREAERAERLREGFTDDES